MNYVIFVYIFNRFVKIFYRFVNIFNRFAIAKNFKGLLLNTFNTRSSRV